MDWPKNARFFQFQNKVLLAIDYGSKVIGLSQFTPGRDPFPLLSGKIVVKNRAQVLSRIEEIIKEENIDMVIVGVPRLTDGGETDATRHIQKFLAQLAQKLIIPVLEQDETLSTFEAKQRMSSDPRFNFQVDPKKIDEVSASIILEEFLKTQI